MEKYYTRACNFYFGAISKEKVKKKKSIPLHNNKLISFDTVEIISRKKTKVVNIHQLNKLKISIKDKIFNDLKKISKKKNF